MTPPMIVVKPETQTMSIANTIRFKCEAHGNPTPEITWYHNGQRLKLHGMRAYTIENDDRRQELTFGFIFVSTIYILYILGRVKTKNPQLLLVSNTVSNDSGAYQCFASNQYGTTWAGALFTISSSPYEPAPPMNIRCRTLSSTQIQLSWRKSTTDIPIDPPIIVQDHSIQLNSHGGVSSSAAVAAATSGSSNATTANKVFRAYSIHYMPTGNSFFPLQCVHK